MRFGIDNIIVWSNGGARRQLHFERNKVNVLTGESHTGKSALLDILDYCFLASSHKIAEGIINENVAWYGVRFYINEKLFTVARHSPAGTKVSDEYFISTTGVIPEQPQRNIKEVELKAIFETEFSIDDSVKLAYGGQTLKAGSKVSFRYFLLFSTISEDIITSRNVYFDKQNEERYKEALPRIFDIAMGIDTLANIAAREKKEALRKQIAKLERKSAALDEGRAVFQEELQSLEARAASYGLPRPNDGFQSAEDFARTLREAAAPNNDDALSEYSRVSAHIFDLERRLRNLRAYSKEFSAYRATLKHTEDSLLPLERILEQSAEVVKSEVFDALIANLKSDLSEIKSSIKSKLPIDGQVTNVIEKLQVQRRISQSFLDSLPKEPASFESEKEKWVFIGETLGKLNVYGGAREIGTGQASEDVAALQARMDEISVADVAEKKDAVLSVINEVALALLRATGEVLANYSTYLPEFVYKEKRLWLRKPRSSDVENIGSSSNHMFLHLLHFLALQEVAIGQRSPFVPSFLIVDQPSRPYYPDDKPKDAVVLNNSDTAKVHTAFKLLNDFITNINVNYEREFQMIVLEHVPATTFLGMENIHVLPEFRNGEALIPASWK